MAYNSISNLALDTIRSITHPKVAQKIADNITQKIPLLNYLNKMGNKEHESGGAQYWIPVFKELQTGTFYTGLTVLSNNEADPVTTAVYERKAYSLDITVSGTKLLQNSGSNEEAIISYLETLIETAQESAKNDLAGSASGLMSASADSDLGITGLQTYLPSSTTTGTVGTLSRATYPFWRHNADTVSTSFSSNGLAKMRSMYFTCVRGDETPTLIVMTQNGFINLVTALTGTIQYNQPVGLTPAAGDVDFPSIKFHGADVVFDYYMPVNTIYFLNLKYMKLMVHGDRDMTIREFIAPSNQDALVARLYWAGNLVSSNLSRQGVLTGSIDNNS